MLMQAVTYSPSDLIGEGGEAEVYRVSPNTVAKIYKQHDAARVQKLRTLPQFPPCVVAPIDLCSDGSGKVIGYTMPLIENAYHLKQLANKDFRTKSGIANDQVVNIFRRLQHALQEVHAAKIVIGDFNPLNVLVDSNNQPRLLDADSMQFNGFYSSMFTLRYADPSLFDQRNGLIDMAAPHTQLSDWYAYAVMLFESLLFVHPYGGVYKPADKKVVPPDQRPFRRISVFHPEVAYPSAAVQLTQLPNVVLDYFRCILEKDLREPFPSRILDALQGKTFTTLVARPIAAFQAPGTLVFACMQQGRQRYVYHLNGKFYREDGKVIMSGDLDHALNFAIDGDNTIVSKHGQSFRFPQFEPLAVEWYRDHIPCIASNGKQLFWVAGGELWCKAREKTSHIASVISKQTRIWAGNNFGIALSHAGTIVRAFVFEPEMPRTPVIMPNIPGYITDAECCFDNETVWLAITARSGKDSTCYCICIDRQGRVVAEKEPYNITN